MALLEAVTLVAEGQVPEHIYTEAQAQLTDIQISAIEWSAIVINTWNRIAISSRYLVKP